MPGEKEHFEPLDEGNAMRRDGGLVRVLKGSYSDLKPEPPDNKWKFPDKYCLSVEKLAEGLGKKNWKYDQVNRDARRLIPDIKETDLDELPEELRPYEGNQFNDLGRAVENTETRIKNAKRMVQFGSSIHGEILSQELYESGWDWYSE
jgi:hypothetical protein